MSVWDHTPSDSQPEPLFQARCHCLKGHCHCGLTPMWEEVELLRQQLAEANATIARLHESVSQMRRERKHLG